MNPADLKGLRLIWTGFLSSLIGGVMTCFGSGSLLSSASQLNDLEPVGTVYISSSIGGVISFIALIMIIVGLSMLKSISDYFIKARRLLVISIIVGVVMVVALVIFALLLFLTALAASATALTGYVGLGILVVVLAAILVVLNILFYKNLLHGCSDMAALFRENELAEKFIKLWRLYIIGTILIIAGVLIYVFGGIAVFSIGVTLQGEAVVSIIIVTEVILLGAGMVISPIFIILLLVRLWSLCTLDEKKPGEM